MIVWSNKKRNVVTGCFNKAICHYTSAPTCKSKRSLASASTRNQATNHNQRKDYGYEKSNAKPCIRTSRPYIFCT